MPFEAFDLEKLTKERRESIAKTIRTASADELRNRQGLLEREVEALTRKRDALRRRLDLKTEEVRLVAEGEASVQAAEARVRQAEIAVKAAELRLQRCQIRAATNGRASAARRLRTMGAQLVRNVAKAAA